MTGPARSFAGHGIPWQESKLPKRRGRSDHRESPTRPVLEHPGKTCRQHRHSRPFHAVPALPFASPTNLHCECSVDQFLAPSQHRLPSPRQFAVFGTIIPPCEMPRAALSRQFRESSRCLQRLPQRPQPGQRAALALPHRRQQHVESRPDPAGSQLQNELCCFRICVIFQLLMDILLVNTF